MQWRVKSIIPPKQWQNSFSPHTQKLTSRFKVRWLRSAAQRLRGHRKCVTYHWIPPLEDMDVALFETSVMRTPPHGIAALTLYTERQYHCTQIYKISRDFRSPLFLLPLSLQQDSKQYSIVEYRTTGTFPAHQEDFPLKLWSMGSKTR